MDPLSILQKYYPPQSKALEIILNHSRKVAEKAIAIANQNPQLEIDTNFLEEAALLHDIGYIKVNLPLLDCHGQADPLLHGVIGREILEQEGLPRHALVAERHVGGGIDKQQIIERHLPLPPRDMIPQTNEEKLIAFVDKFYTKGDLHKTITADEIIAKLSAHSPKSVEHFLSWQKLFNTNQIC